MNIIKSIQNRIYEIRGERVMFDFDLAVLYEVETRVLNQAVKRNIKRFPKDFMFQPTKEELAQLKSQIVTSNPSSQTVMMGKIPQNRTGKYLPYVFTEQGVAMLSGVINSDKAIDMNIAIMRAFVEIRRIVLQQGDIKEQLKQIQHRIIEHDTQLSSIYDAIENLLDEKVAQKKWDDRERIGFKK
jgi:hypothetical protein